MKFKIGNLEVETSEALGTDAFTPYKLRHPEKIGRVPRAVYFWDCRLKDGNPKRPNHLVVEPHLTTLVLTPTGREDAAKTSAVGRRLLAASGLADGGKKQGPSPTGRPPVECTFFDYSLLHLPSVKSGRPRFANSLLSHWSRQG